ncbi:hypothetical protein Btru_003605 [Bulinus truncatus]|nr:hypothetical protein Btru_003605 [Bulinus truncatus]
MEKQRQIDDFMEGDDLELDVQDKFAGNWAKVDANLKNEGFRIGMEEGYEQFLQKGFNAAFKDAMKMSFSAGKLQGLLSVHTCNFPESALHRPDSKLSSSPPAITNLLSSCSDLISKIPTILKNEAAQSLAQTSLHANNELHIESQHSLEKHHRPMSAACQSKSLTQSKKDNEQTDGQGAQNFVSCHEICNSKEHFWSQLESFRLQTSELVSEN